jgi:ketosteroid isomerase-like protein
MMDDKLEIEAVETVVRKVWYKFSQQDPKGMLELLAEECTVWDIFQPDLVNKKNMQKYIDIDFQQSANRGLLTYEMSKMHTTVWDNTAVCRFIMDFTYQEPNATKGAGRITVVLRKPANKGWLVAHVHEGMLPTGIPDHSQT